MILKSILISAGSFYDFSIHTVHCYLIMTKGNTSGFSYPSTTFHYHIHFLETFNEKCASVTWRLNYGNIMVYHFLLLWYCFSHLNTSILLIHLLLRSRIYIRLQFTDFLPACLLHFLSLLLAPEKMLLLLIYNADNLSACLFSTFCPSFQPLA